MQICQVAGLLFMVFLLRALMFCFTSARKCEIVRSIIEKGVHLPAKRCTAKSEKVYTKLWEGVHLF